MNTQKEENLKDVLSKFNIDTEIDLYGSGNINDTYLCKDCGFILQRINTEVFKNPDDVMENIYNVTRHIAEKIEKNGGEPRRETLNLIPTKTGEIYYKTDSGDCFRMYKLVENTVSYDIAQNPQTLTSAGRAFGKFQRLLSDFPAEKLHETIVDFHNTPVRVTQLEDAIKNDLSHRIEQAKDEIAFARKYKKYANIITDAIKNGEVPVRVTHNDTKLNNVLFDKKSGEGICVIDLDTVMPGSLLYDFGDAMRYGASNCEEDETDTNKIWFDLEKLDAFSQGFLEEVGSCLTNKEIELLPVSALIIAIELGMRFLTDYLNGDIYFKTRYETHNLDRARNQFILAMDIEKKLPQIIEIVKKYI